MTRLVSSDLIPPPKEGYVRILLGCVPCGRITSRLEDPDRVTLRWTDCCVCDAPTSKWSEEEFLAKPELHEMYRGGAYIADNIGTPYETQRQCSHSSKRRTSGFDPYSNFTCNDCGDPC